MRSDGLKAPGPWLAADTLTQGLDIRPNCQRLREVLEFPELSANLADNSEQHKVFPRSTLRHPEQYDYLKFKKVGKLSEPFVTFLMSYDH